MRGLWWVVKFGPAAEDYRVGALDRQEGEAGVEDVWCDDDLGLAGGRGGRCCPVDGADVVAALGGEGGDVAADAA